MKNILLIGVGGTGSQAVDIFFQRYNEFGKQNDNKVTALVFDTDKGDLERITSAKGIVMADPASVGTICDRIGKEYLREWFPCDDPAVRAQEMLRGASQWRKKSYLAFLNLMNQPVERQKFISALEEMVADPKASCEVYVISSVAGGTGSGSFIPIALYAKRYLRKSLGKDPIVNAMIALPDIYADAQTPENRVKVYANAYAILRELNAINLVARNYNEGRTARKKAPIKFRIGHPDEPNVGVLFDASDRKYWTPEAAPFSQVFLLDRIPRVNGVTAHNIVLANSLYTILCTDIGAKFDSEFSNHELLRSQNNGGNAIYAGVSTSQIRFPHQSVLNYIAHKKTLDSCNNEWLVLHTQVENLIREKEQQAKEEKKRFSLAEGEYAEIVLDVIRNLEDNGNDIIQLIERGTVDYDKNGKKLPKSRAKTYYEARKEAIADKIPSIEQMKQKIDGIYEEKGKPNADDFSAAVGTVKNQLKNYYRDCIDNIKRVVTSTADTLISLDRKKEDLTGKEISIAESLLKKNKKYIHPVCAMAQLCELRNLIAGEYNQRNGFVEWTDFRSRDISSVPSSLLETLAIEDIDDGKDDSLSNAKKSAYGKLGAERLAEACKGDFSVEGKTNVKEDLKVLRFDAIRALNKIHDEAMNQLLNKVMQRVAKDLDILIEKYRVFFTRFNKEKEELAEATKSALISDSENIDSVINIYASKDDKKKILEQIENESGPESEADIIESDDLVGKGVFETVYKAAVASASNDTSYNEKDASGFRSLFASMVDGYKEFVKKGDAFQKIASYNVIEAIVEANGGDYKNPKLKEAFNEVFHVAEELAKPSLRIDDRGDIEELVAPSEITVYMMSTETGRYLKKHAEDFKLHLPADQTKEGNVIYSCAEEFIRNFSGNPKARVTVVDSMANYTLYCTGEIMDITPLRISKFDELGEDNLYFKNYAKAVECAKKRDTDMWNPHIGNDLHKRGYLPYMNEEKERQCDYLVVKALIYALNKQIITYDDGNVEMKGHYYFKCNNEKIVGGDGKWINNKNIAQLVAWLRNEDELIEDWAHKFDLDIQRQKNMLPAIASDNPTEIAKVEAALTNSDIMRAFTSHLYEDGQYAATKGATGKGPSIIEFAHNIKTSEESAFDCDDAERILIVAYEIFKDMISYRAIPEVNPERFMQVYRQQLDKIYQALASSKLVAANGADCVAQFNQIVNWMNYAGTFKTISNDMPMDEFGNVAINTNYKASSDVIAILDKVAKA